MLNTRAEIMRFLANGYEKSHHDIVEEMQRRGMWLAGARVKLALRALVNEGAVRRRREFQPWRRHQRTFARILFRAPRA